MNWRARLGVPTLSAALIATAASCGNGEIDNAYSAVSGGTSSLLEAHLAESSPREQVPTEHGLLPDVLAAAMSATVRITGMGCTEAQFGTGFVVAEGTVVTNAHVVAGIAAPRIISGDQEMASRVVGFDPVTDLAILSVDAPLPRAFSLVEATVGSVGAILGYDDEGSPAVRPARIRQVILATGKDIYGEPAEGRQALVVDATVEMGFSGSPIVDQGGAVIGAIFSRARGGKPVAYAIQTGEIIALLDEVTTGVTGPGPCR